MNPNRNAGRVGEKPLPWPIRILFGAFAIALFWTLLVGVIRP